VRVELHAIGGGQGTHLVGSDRTRFRIEPQRVIMTAHLYGLGGRSAVGSRLWSGCTSGARSSRRSSAGTTVSGGRCLIDMSSRRLPVMSWGAEAGLAVWWAGCKDGGGRGGRGITIPRGGRWRGGSFWGVSGLGVVDVKREEDGWELVVLEGERCRGEAEGKAGAVGTTLRFSRVQWNHRADP